MNQALAVTDILFNVLGGLGLFFTGVGILWYASIQKKK